MTCFLQQKYGKLSLRVTGHWVNDLSQVGSGQRSMCKIFKINYFIAFSDLIGLGR